jgi:hypothetical protein
MFQAYCASGMQFTEIKSDMDWTPTQHVLYHNPDNE